MLKVGNSLHLPILFATKPVREEAAEDEDGGEEHGEERHPVVQVEPAVPAGVPHVVHHLGQSQLSTGGSPPIAAHLAQGQHHLGAGAREDRLGHEAAHVADEGGQEGHAGAALREGEQREGVHLENDE